MQTCTAPLHHPCCVIRILINVPGNLWLFLLAVFFFLTPLIVNVDKFSGAMQQSECTQPFRKEVPSAEIYSN